MHIKKLILLLFLAPVLAQAQKTTGPNYTYIGQRYEWVAGMFKGLGLPAGDSAQFQTGQELRAGAIYYDSTGVDSGLYVWSGLVWRPYEPYTDADARAAISLTTTGTSGAATYDNGTGVFNIPNYGNANFYNADGTLSGARNVNSNSNNLTFSNTATFGVYDGAFVTNRFLVNTAQSSLTSPNGVKTISVTNSGVAASLISTATANVVYYDDGTGLLTYGAAPSIGNTIYTGDGTLTGNRDITLGGNYLRALQGANEVLLIDPTAGNEATVLQAYNTTGLGNNAAYSGLTTNADATAHIGTTFNGANIGKVQTFSDASGSLNTYTATNHEFNGDLNISNTYKFKLGSNAGDLGSLSNGHLFYNSTTGKFRAYEGGVLKDMITTATTPTLQQVLDAGSTLTSSETITAGANSLSVNGDYANTSINSVLGGIYVSSTNASSLSINSTYVGTGSFFNRTNSNDGFPTASFVNHTAATNSVVNTIAVSSATSGTPGDGLGTAIRFTLETTGTGGAESITSNRFISKFTTVDHPTRTSQIDIEGVDNAATETFMNIQKDLVRINNNADTLATKAYARSVGGGGAANLIDLDDVTVTDVKKGNLIFYDSTSAKYINGYEVDRRRNVYEYFEDFPNAVIGTYYNSRVSGAGASVNQSQGNSYASNKRPGVVRLITGTTATGYASIDMIAGGRPFVFQTGNNYGEIKFETSIQFSDISTASQEYVFYAGINADGRTAAPNRSIYFQYDRAANGDFWSLVAAGASGTSTVVTTTPVTEDLWHKLELRLNSDATSVTAFINGVEVVASSGTYPITTNIYDGTGGDATGAQIITRKTVGTTSHTTFIDYIGLQQIINGTR